MQVADYLAQLRTMEESALAAVPVDPQGADRTPWLVRTGWLLYFEARNTKAVAALARMPDRNGEPALLRLAEITRDVLSRCLESVEKSSAFVRRWLNSPKPAECHLHPFNTLQDEATREQYFNYWVCFLCFLLRVVGSNSEKEHGVQLSANERSMALALLRLLKLESSERESSRDEMHDEMMREMVLRFSVAFLQKDISAGDREDLCKPFIFHLM